MFGITKSRMMIVVLLVIGVIIVLGFTALGPNSTLLKVNGFQVGSLIGTLGIVIGIPLGLFVVYKLFKSL